jgi:hypothetical protein
MKDINNSTAITRKSTAQTQHDSQDRTAFKSSQRKATKGQPQQKSYDRSPDRIAPKDNHDRIPHERDIYPEWPPQNSHQRTISKKGTANNGWLSKDSLLRTATKKRANKKSRSGTHTLYTGRWKWCTYFLQPISDIGYQGKSLVHYPT